MMPLFAIVVPHQIGNRSFSSTRVLSKTVSRLIIFKWRWLFMEVHSISTVFLLALRSFLTLVAYRLPGFPYYYLNLIKLEPRLVLVFTFYLVSHFECLFSLFYLVSHFGLKLCVGYRTKQIIIYTNKYS